MDITKCSGENCPVKEKCYRFTAPRHYFRQSYFIIPPIKTTEEGKLDCEQYWGKGDPFKKLTINHFLNTENRTIMKAQFKNEPLANIKWATERSHKSFNMLAGINRGVVANHVTKLAESILKLGILRPIIVSRISFITGKPKLYIIDGQHTFHALIRNNVPIPYVEIDIKDKEDLIEKIALLNSSSKGWSLLDYVTAWSSLISDYVKLNQYHETYDVDLSFLAATLNDFSADGGKTTTKIKKGQFRIVNEEECVKFLDHLRDVLSIIPRMSRLQNIYACREFLRFYKSANKYNHKKVLTALQKNKDKFILATQEEGSLTELLRKICKN